MSYYTGTIFEISMDEFGGSVGGGGRYDEMIGKFTGQDTPAVGFSIGAGARGPGERVSGHAGQYEEEQEVPEGTACRTGIYRDYGGVQWLSQ